MKSARSSKYEGMTKEERKMARHMKREVEKQRRKLFGKVEKKP